MRARKLWGTSGGIAPWLSSGTMASGDQAWMVMESPYHLREKVSVSAHTLGGVESDFTIGSLRQAFSQAPAGGTMIRHEVFWPILRLPRTERNAPILTTDRRILYDWRVDFEEPPDGLDAMLDFTPWYFLDRA